MTQVFLFFGYFFVAVFSVGRVSLTGPAFGRSYIVSFSLFFLFYADFHPLTGLALLGFL